MHCVRVVVVNHGKHDVGNVGVKLASLGAGYGD